MSNKLDMVTLSACETGLGTFKQGEGVRSLAVSFLNAGTRSIVYSLWEADDQSTSTIMALFYRYLQEGKNKDEALVEAKKTFLLTCSPDKRHPYYWAGFVIAGDTSPLDSLFSKNQLYGALAVALLLMIYLFFYFKNKTK
jgi:CHAT domain-containing protein